MRGLVAVIAASLVSLAAGAALAEGNAAAAREQYSTATVSPNGIDAFGADNVSTTPSST